MTNDLIKFKLPAAFVLARARLLPSEIAYGYHHGWLDEEAVVKLAESASYESLQHDPQIDDLALLLQDEYWRVPELVDGVETPSNDDPSRVWIYLALAWMFEQRQDAAVLMEEVAMLAADFDYPDEIAGLVNFLPAPPGARVGPNAIVARWEEFLRDQAVRFGGRRV